MYKVKRFSKEDKKTKLEKESKGLVMAGTALGALAAKDAVSAANSLRKTGATMKEVKESLPKIGKIVSEGNLNDLKKLHANDVAKHGKKSAEALTSKSVYNLKRASNRAKGAGAALLAAGTIYGVDKARKYLKGKKEASSEPMA